MVARGQVHSTCQEGKWNFMVHLNWGGGGNSSIGDKLPVRGFHFYGEWGTLGEHLLGN